jgi:hypothetical protein
LAFQRASVPNHFKTCFTLCSSGFIGDILALLGLAYPYSLICAGVSLIFPVAKAILFLSLRFFMASLPGSAPVTECVSSTPPPRPTLLRNLIF